jgi:hypothetical protein
VTDLNQTLYGAIELLMKRKLSQLIPQSAKFSSIFEDEPYYKLKYTATNTDYEVSCIYDSFLKRVNITNVAVTSDVENSTDNSNKNSKILTFNSARTSGMVRSGLTPYLPLPGPVFFPQFLSGVPTPIITGSPQLITNQSILQWPSRKPLQGGAVSHNL